MRGVRNPPLDVGATGGSAPNSTATNTKRSGTIARCAVAIGEVIGQCYSSTPLDGIPEIPTRH